MADWWMKSGTTSTDDDANSPHMGGGTFVTGDYDPLSVTSEKASRIRQLGHQAK